MTSPTHTSPYVTGQKKIQTRENGPLSAETCFISRPVHRWRMVLFSAATVASAFGNVIEGDRR